VIAYEHHEGAHALDICFHSGKCANHGAVLVSAQVNRSIVKPREQSFVDRFSFPKQQASDRLGR
jgi:hypothetical protein